jgi:hypothetical protein
MRRWISKLEFKDTGTFRPALTGPFGLWFNYLENTETLTPPATPGLRQVILVDGAGTITLPKASDAEFGYYIKSLITGTVTIATNGETIDGATSYSITTQYNAIHVISDGSNWHIIGRYS